MMTISYIYIAMQLYGNVKIVSTYFSAHIRSYVLKTCKTATYACIAKLTTSKFNYIATPNFL